MVWASIGPSWMTYRCPSMLIEGPDQVVGIELVRLGDDDGPVVPPHPGTSRAASAKSTMRRSEDNRLLLDWLSERLRVIMRDPSSLAHRVDASTLVETPLHQAPPTV